MGAVLDALIAVSIAVSFVGGLLVGGSYVVDILAGPPAEWGNGSTYSFDRIPWYKDFELPGEGNYSITVRSGPGDSLVYLEYTPYLYTNKFGEEIFSEGVTRTPIGIISDKADLIEVNFTAPRSKTPPIVTVFPKPAWGIENVTVEIHRVKGPSPI